MEGERLTQMQALLDALAASPALPACVNGEKRGEKREEREDKVKREKKR